MATYPQCIHLSAHVHSLFSALYLSLNDCAVELPRMLSVRLSAVLCNQQIFGDTFTQQAASKQLILFLAPHALRCECVVFQDRRFSGFTSGLVPGKVRGAIGMPFIPMRQCSRVQQSLTKKKRERRKIPKETMPRAGHYRWFMDFTGRGEIISSAEATGLSR